jgi:putative hydrolase of the HAD superfamily
LLIIFDLDDTLIDTSGSITPHALKRALRAMISAGLYVPSFNQALEYLSRINAAALSGAAALTEFVEIHEGDAKFISIGKREWYGDLPADLAVFPLDGAIELLKELSISHKLALVTGGKMALQMEKMKKAGIDTAIFSKIIASEDGNKKNYYHEVKNTFGYSAKDVLVCGDRVLIDLTPAKELGFKTVHMRWGRGLTMQNAKSGDIDFQINALNQLKDIIKNL